MVDKAEYSRTDVYLKPEGQQPKHMFKCIGDIIERYYGLGAAFALLDVGAASGAFADYISTRFRNLRVCGLERDSRLVHVARNTVPKATFLLGDANCMQEIDDGSFELVVMTGTHSIFDDFRSSFSECVRATRDGGVVIITGIFNPWPVDAQIYWRYGAQFEASWHPGYNLFSKLSVSTFLGAHPRVSGHAFELFSLPFDIAPGSDPVRSWTVADESGGRTLRNGIMPLNMEMLVIEIARG